MLELPPKKSKKKGEKASEKSKLPSEIACLKIKYSDEIGFHRLVFPLEVEFYPSLDLSTLFYTVGRTFLNF